MKKSPIAKQIAQTSILGILLLGVALVFFSSPRGQRLLGGSPDGRSDWSMWDTTRTDDERDFDVQHDSDMDEDIDEELSLPASQNVRDALEKLDQARSRLLTVATTGDSAELEAAGSEYRTCVQEVQSSFARLRSFVEPEDYGTLVEQLVSTRRASEQWSMDDLMPEWHLGVLKRENSR